MLNGDSILFPFFLVTFFILVDRLLLRINTSQKQSVLIRIISIFIIFYAYVIISAWVLSLLHILVPDIWRLVSLFFLFVLYSTNLIIETKKRNIFLDIIKNIINQNKLILLFGIIVIFFSGTDRPPLISLASSLVSGSTCCVQLKMSSVIS